MDGLDRVARKRNDVALPPAAVVISLLAKIGCLSVEDGMASPSTPADLPEPGSNDRWLYDLLIAQPDESMHVDDVLRVARAEGRSEASIGSHLTYSPVVRRVGGVVSLVGADLAPAERARIKRVANAKRVESDYTVEWTDRGPVVTLALGTAYLTSAVVGMRKDLLESVKVSGLSTACCRNYRSDARLGISGLNAVYGWTTLFHHWVTAHGVSEGDQVRVLLSESVVSTLEPWAADEQHPPAFRGAEGTPADNADGEVLQDIAEPMLWAPPDQPVQLGLQVLEDEEAAVKRLQSRAVSRRGPLTASHPGLRPVAREQETGLWKVPTQGVLGADDESVDQVDPVIGLPRPAGRLSPRPAEDGPEPGSPSPRQRGETRLDPVDGPSGPRRRARRIHAQRTVRSRSSGVGRSLAVHPSNRRARLGGQRGGCHDPHRRADRRSRPPPRRMEGGRVKPGLPNWSTAPGSSSSRTGVGLPARCPLRPSGGS